MKFERFTLTAIFIACGLLAGADCTAQPISDREEFFRQLATALQDPTERKKVRSALNGWSAEQKKEFSSSVSAQIQHSLTPKLPMQIDATTVWRSLRMTDSAMYADIVVLDPKLSDPKQIAAEESTIKNYMCTTPANALLLMIGYKFFLSYYDQTSRYITQLQYAAADCGL